MSKCNGQWNFALQNFLFEADILLFASSFCTIKVQEEIWPCTICQPLSTHGRRRNMALHNLLPMYHMVNALVSGSFPHCTAGRLLSLQYFFDCTSFPLALFLFGLAIPMHKFFRRNKLIHANGPLSSLFWHAWLLASLAISCRLY